jgi:hypothetical protein
MSLIEILAIIIIHWIADFIMQDEKWALGKSKNWSDLLSHTWIYSVVFFGLLPFLNPLFDIGITFYQGFYFFLITFITHTITDYITSRVVSKRFQKEAPFDIQMTSNMFDAGHVISSDTTTKKISLIVMAKYLRDNITYKVKWYNPIPNFGAFTLIGFDQVLHYVQLFLTYYYLVKI